MPGLSPLQLQMMLILRRDAEMFSVESIIEQVTYLHEKANEDCVLIEFASKGEVEAKQKDSTI